MPVDVPDLAYRLRLNVKSELAAEGIDVEGEAADKAFAELQNAFEEVLEEIILDIEVPERVSERELL